jgi:hypothetical protein
MDQRLDRLLHLRECDARMTKQRELNSKTDPVSVPTPACHELLIGTRERVEHRTKRSGSSIGLTGLIPLRCQPEVRANGLR